MFKNPPIMMKEKLQTFHYGVAVMKNNFIYHLTEDVMSALIEAGIPQYFLNYIEDVVLKELLADPIELKKFGVEDLTFGFVIFLGFCALSVLIFFLEIIYSKIRPFNSRIRTS